MKQHEPLRPVYSRRNQYKHAVAAIAIWTGVVIFWSVVISLIF